MANGLEQNFDVIFSGSMEEQHCKASHFVKGIGRLVREAEARYASAVLAGEPAGSRHDAVHELEEAATAFKNDPRLDPLQDWINQKHKKEHEARLREMLDGVVKQILE